ncbi:carboxypeptidase-like regulatory domain-containing protein [Rufibacter glacialis]|uniref:Carboxypeptidase-like regulatory domain-containing protein n=1 Tax=Rufibacter glacialis TaxID=1259555 RepID=A0ABV4RJ31_9BACT|nr:carboxypeptidase-like regulatory domain-containing protein [Rufibacter glacialis]GGK58102.1 hypothetical protein GCM10011405_02670 [Rufibacter glacialis]
MAKKQTDSSFTVSGLIQNSQTKEPIAYASIGLLQEAKGTISNAKGVFRFSLPTNQKSGIVRISAIGYEARELAIEELLTTGSQTLLLELVPTAVPLPEVQVKAKTWKTKELGGNAGPITFFHHNFGVFQRPIEENLGRELGIFIHNRDKVSFISKLNFCLTSNKYDQVTFRVKIYTLQEGKPAQNITPSNILHTVKNKQKGWIQVNLEPYNLYVDQDFAIALEWVDCAPRSQDNSLTIAASLPGFHTTFYKDASQATWDKMSSIGMGMNVVVQREK